MSIFQAIILGAVQGLAEFLPVSSSGHLAVVEYFFKQEDLLDFGDGKKIKKIVL